MTILYSCFWIYQNLMNFRGILILNNVYMSTKEIKSGIYVISETLEINYSIGL